MWRKICLLVIVLSLARTLFELLNLCTSTFVCIQNHTAVLKIIDMALGLPFSLFFLIKITFFLIFDPESALLSFYLHLSTHSRHWPSWHFRDNILFNSVIAWGKQFFFQYSLCELQVNDSQRVCMLILIPSMFLQMTSANLFLEFTNWNHFFSLPTVCYVFLSQICHLFIKQTKFFEIHCESYEAEVLKLNLHTNIFHFCYQFVWLATQIDIINRKIIKLISAMKM